MKCWAKSGWAKSAKPPGDVSHQFLGEQRFGRARESCLAALLEDEQLVVVKPEGFMADVGNQHRNAFASEFVAAVCLQ